MLFEILIYTSAYIGLFAVIFYVLTFFSKKKEKAPEIREKELPGVSIIIPAYNEEEGIAETIKSALNLDYPKEKIEIIIVDDGSKDKTYEIAYKFKDKNVKVFRKENAGKGSALNYGIARAKGEVIVTMDADSMAEKNALKNMVVYFTRPEVMCVAPIMAIHKPKSILQRVQQIEYLLGIFLRKAFARMNAIHITPGAFSAYRSGFFKEYGGFDEKNLTEDLEMALRIQYNNFIIENSTTAVVYTIAPKNFKALFKQRRRWYYGFIKNLLNYKQLLSKKYGDMGLIVLPIAMITVLLSIFLTSYLIVRTIFDIKKELIFLKSVNFDFSSFFNLNKYVFERLIFKLLSDPVVMFIFLFMLILFAYMAFAKSKIREQPNLKLNVILFIIFYSFLYALWWGVSFAYFILKKEVGWGKKQQNINTKKADL